MDLGLAIQETIVGIRISMLNLSCLSIFNQNEQLRISNFSAEICPKKDLRLEIEKSNVGITINIVETLCVPISVNLDNFNFLDPNLPKNVFRVKNSYK